MGVGASGLDFFQARYYDPAVGRFAQADSALGADALGDGYGYVGGMLENATDPGGHQLIVEGEPGDTGAVLTGGYGGAGDGGDAGAAALAAAAAPAVDDVIKVLFLVAAGDTVGAGAFWASRQPAAQQASIDTGAGNPDTSLAVAGLRVNGANVDIYASGDAKGALLVTTHNADGSTTTTGYLIGEAGWATYSHALNQALFSDDPPLNSVRARAAHWGGGRDRRHTRRWGQWRRWGKRRRWRWRWRRRGSG